MMDMLHYNQRVQNLTSLTTDDPGTNLDCRSLLENIGWGWGQVWSYGRSGSEGGVGGDAGECRCGGGRG